ncbi:MAG: hypothetical protein Q7J68_01735, partial [Thermoplasmata archaeon]|nr:hypothetical protein [Thermoplasmata archaeon]
MGEMTNNWAKSLDKPLLVIIILWAIFAILFGLYDLQISTTLVNERSLYGEFGRDFGELPGYSLIIICILIVIGNIVDLNSWKRTLGLSGVSMGLAIAGYGILNGLPQWILSGSILTISTSIY